MSSVLHSAALAAYASQAPALGAYLLLPYQTGPALTHIQASGSATLLAEGTQKPW